jgi:PEP-CTERM motif
MYRFQRQFLPPIRYPGSASAYLMDAIGPGTTVANEIASTVVSLPIDGDSLIPIFSGLTLGSGAYYLMMASAQTNDWWRFTSNSNVTKRGGVAYNGGQYSLALNPYAPGSGVSPYQDTANSGRMLVTGDATPTPEPRTYALIAGGLAGIAMIRRRRR